jgi:hypothetical protein
VTSDDQERLREITDWFEGQGFILAFNEVGGEWAVAAIAPGVRIGVASTGGGASQFEAAAALFEKAQNGQMPGVIVKDEDGNVTIHPPVAGGQQVEDSAVGRDAATVTRHPDFERVLGDFGWTFWFTNKPGGSRSYIIADAKTGEPLKSGKGDMWDDVLLAAITDLYPPSDEGLAG